MKSTYKNVLILVFILFTFSVNGQSNDYPKKTINGSEYYIYTVQPQEGLYSISKRFNISQDEISNLNPEISDGLKNGQKILIPTGKEKNDIAKIEYIEHIVQKRQTLYSICKKYKVDLNVVKGINPQLENGLKTGDTLKIPVISLNNSKVIKISEKKSADKKQPENSNELSFVIHEVKSKETLYSISKIYDIDIESIVLINPEIKSKLKKGTKLKIPSKSSIKKLDENNDTNKQNELNLNSSETNKGNHNKNNSTLKIAFLLPLMLDHTTADSGNEKFVDFYAGSLLALSEAKKNGNSFEIYSFDTEKSENAMANVLLNPELKKMDFIVGPAFSNQVAMMSDFARQNKISTLIPFTSKVYDIDVNPYLLQFNPGFSIESKFIASIINSKYKNAQLILVEQNLSNNTIEDNSYFPYLKNELNKLNRKYTLIKTTNNDAFDFSSVMNQNEKNIVFFNSDKISSINGYLSNLNGFSSIYDISIYKQFSWINNEQITLKGFYVSPFISATNSYLLNKYQNQFEKYFDKSTSNETLRYDLLGYDLTKHFIELLLKKGADFQTELLELPESKGIQSQFNFERKTTKSGFVNKHLYFIEK